MPRVSIHDTEKTFEVEENEILHDALSNRGEILPHGCLSGSCGACRIEVIEGEANLIPPGMVEANTIESIKEEFRESLQDKSVRLSCRARVIGDVVIRPIK